MHNFSSKMILLVYFYQRLIADFADSLLTQLRLESSTLILFTMILSVSTAILVWIVFMRILPKLKPVTGTWFVLALSWYLSRIGENRSYLRVRSVGLALILGTALLFALAGKDRSAESGSRIQLDSIGVAESVIGAD